MLCPKCGQLLSDNVSVCVHCGSPVNAGQPADSEPSRSAAGEPRHNPVPGALKKQAASPLFLTAVILFSAAALISLISSFFMSTAVTNLVDTYVPAQYLSQVSKLMDAISTVLVVGGVIAAIPNLVSVAGLWMVFASARSSNDNLRRSGLMMNEVVAIIRLVHTGIIAALALFVLALIPVGILTSIQGAAVRFSESGVVYSASSTTPPWFWPLFALVFLATAAVCFFSIFYHLRVVNMLSCAHAERPDSNPSMFVAVVCFITGAISGINAFSLLFTTGFLPFISTLTSGAATFAFGLVILSYRNALTSADSAA